MDQQSLLSLFCIHYSRGEKTLTSQVVWSLQVVAEPSGEQPATSGEETATHHWGSELLKTKQRGKGIDFHLYHRNILPTSLVPMTPNILHHANNTLIVCVKYQLMRLRLLMESDIWDATGYYCYWSTSSFTIIWRGVRGQAVAFRATVYSALSPPL